MLIKAGVPVFSAPPCPSASGGTCPRPGHQGGAVEYDLPAKWQQTVPAKMWLDQWREGWALGAVGGWAADFLDVDPRNGGLESFGEVFQAGQWPQFYGAASTPSGGEHYLISPLRERKITGLLPGIDYQGGDGAGVGRGFVWIAPTVRRSKTDSVRRAYRWTQEPDLDWLAEWSVDEVAGSTDPSLDGLRLRVAGWRAARGAGMKEARERTGSAVRSFTVPAMQAFLTPLIDRVMKATVGSIEEEANGLACALSHFVPSMITEDAAYGVLLDALGETAYDPHHPASRWEADKFRAVIADVGGRAPGDWHAQLEVADVASALASVDVAGDEVTALLAEMVTMGELAKRKPPRYMIDDVLLYDSESWMIGGPGSKKSFVVLDMAGHVARGMDWQGHKVNPGLVVLIAGEGGGSIGKRVAAWQRKYGEIPADRMRALTRPVQAGDMKAWAVLVKACERLRGAIDPSLGMFVIVDTQARSTVGMDENSAEQMGGYVRAVAALREATGACVLSVHHTGKVGDRTRGSSVLDGAQDTRLLMKSKPGTLDAELVIDKQKDIEQIEPLALRFSKVDVGVDEDGRPLDSLVLLGHEEAAVLRALGAGQVDDSTYEAADEEAARVITPFAVRREPETWTYKRTDGKAGLQRWLLQALADTAEERGLTQAEWRGVVEEKLGKQTATTWRKAFQVVTGSRFDGLVIKVQGADRWVTDPLQRVEDGM